MSGEYICRNPKYVLITCSGCYQNDTQYGKDLVENEVTGVRYDADLKHLVHYLETDIYSFEESYNIRYINNREWKDTRRIINDEINFSEYDSAIFIILTFLGNPGGGEETLVMGARSNAVKYSDIINDVKKIEGLYGKPKIFIIQADDPSLMPERVDERTKAKPVSHREFMKQTIPIDADRLIIKSTIPQVWARYPSHRARNEDQDSSKPCSFLMRAFIDVLSENNSKTGSEKIDLLSLTTEINGRVKTMIMTCKEKYKSQNNDITEKILDDFFSKMKYPMCTTTLRKQLFFPSMKWVGAKTTEGERSLPENRTNPHNVLETDRPFAQNIGTFE